MAAEQEQIDLMFTGCTGAVGLRHPQKADVWVGFAGDSRAILVHPTDGLIAETSDHHPATREDEARRIAESGGEIVSLQYSDGFVNHRVFVKDKKYPGLCMTRSLGDLIVKDHGVISEPEVVKWKLEKGSYLLIASDGVWEFMSSKDTASIIQQGIARGKLGWEQELADVILKKARAEW